MSLFYLCITLFLSAFLILSSFCGIIVCMTKITQTPKSHTVQTMGTKTIKDEDKVKLFKALVSMPFYEAGMSIGLDKRYNTKSAIRGIAYQIYKEVLSKYKKFDISEDLVEGVKQAIEARKASPNRKPVAELDSHAIIDPQDLQSVVLGGRNKAALLLHRKMDILNKSKKALERENLVSLAKVFGIFFDKSQIIQGQATENIAVMAKVKTDMTPQESLEALLSFRESVAISKESS